MTDAPYIAGRGFTVGDRIAWQLADGTYRVGPVESITAQSVAAPRPELPPRPRWWRVRARREWKRLQAAANSWGGGMTAYSIRIGDADPGEVAERMAARQAAVRSAMHDGGIL